MQLPIYAVPIIEMIWCRFIQNYDAEFKSFEALVPQFLAGVQQNADGPDLDRVKESFKKVPMPRAVPLNLSSNHSPWLSSCAAFFAAYRLEKECYRVGQDLWRSLRARPWPGQCPIEAIALPTNGMALEVPGEAVPTIYGFFYDLSTGKEESGHLELRVINLTKPDELDWVLDLANAETVQDAWAGALAKLPGMLPGGNQAEAVGLQRQCREQLPNILNALIYLNEHRGAIKRVNLLAMRSEGILLPDLFEVG